MKIVKRVLLFIIIVILVIVSYFTIDGYSMYKNKISEKSIEDRIADLKNDESYTPISEVPDYYLNAVVAIEDHRFYSHFGVDVLATSRAMIDNIFSFKMKGGRKFYFTTSCQKFMLHTRKNFNQKNCRTFCCLSFGKRLWKRWNTWNLYK